MKKYPLPIQVFIYLAIMLGVGFFLIVAREFLYPLTIAFLFAFLLYPPAKFLEKKGLPRIASTLIIVILAMIAVYFLLHLLAEKIMGFMNDFPSMKENAINTIDRFENMIERNVGVNTDENGGWLKDRLKTFVISGSGFIGEAITATTGTVVKIALMPVYIFFILYYRDKGQSFLLQSVRPELHPGLLQITREISHVMKKYMRGIVIVVAILSVVNSTGLWIIGMDYPVLLGIISAMINFIPYFGTLLGGLVPLSYAMLIENSTHHSIGVVILFLFVQFLENNILTPNITGYQVRLNPFATILSIIIGGMFWGIPGMFVSVPILGMLKVIFTKIPQMQPAAFLLGTSGTEKHSLTWEKIKSVFKRKKE